MVSKRTLKRCKENVEEQKEVLNDSSAQRLQEIKRLRRSPSQKLQSTQFLPPPQSFLLGQLLPTQIEEVAQGSRDCSV